MSARWHLERLGAALARLGWRSELREGESPLLLRVWHPDVPRFGESVSLTVCADGRMWFQTSDHRLLAPVNRPGTAAAQLAAILTPFTGPTAMPRRHAARRRRRAWTRRMLASLIKRE